MVNGKVYAIDAVCSHEGGPLEEGTLEGYEVECPWHGSKFDVRTGELRNPVLTNECLKTNKNLKIIYTITAEGQAPSSRDWKGERGIINKAMLTKYLTTSELNNSVFYICGPPGMLKAMQNLLEDDLHIPKERMRIQEFTGY